MNLCRKLKGESEMKKARLSLSELIRKNKEEILKDKEKLEKIEKRLEEQYTKIK